MPISLHRAVAALCVVVAWLAFASVGAAASPVTVNLRIEGSTKTLFEGPIATDARTINGPDSSTHVVGPHPCDFKDNGSNGSFGPSLGTPTTAAFDAAGQSGLTFAATWYSSQNDFLVTQIGPDANGGAPTFPSWGFAVNNSTSSVGGCQIGLAAGNQVLWAFDYFNKQHLLSLAGPTTANLGQPIALHVTDGQSGAGLMGATVGSGATDGQGNPQTTYAKATDAQGNVQVTFSHTGVYPLKAFRSDSVRSNRLDVCVHNGDDGNCGAATTGPGGAGSGAAPGSGQPGGAAGGGAPAPSGAGIGRLFGIAYGHRFAHGHGPRVLRGAVAPDPAGIASIRLRLSRRTSTKCQGFDGRRERFRPTLCGAEHAPWFSVGEELSFSYLLPHRLGPGRYVVDMEVVDRAGHRDDHPTVGRTRIVFSVA
jgi:hypothetical protein